MGKQKFSILSIVLLAASILFGCQSQVAFAQNGYTVTSPTIVTPCIIVSPNTYCTKVSSANPMPIGAAANSFVNITTATTTVVKSSSGYFQGITVNGVSSATTGTIICYDAVTATGTKVGTWTVNTGQILTITTPNGPVTMSNGITCVTSVAMNITVYYR